jgi:hypothetical protein
MKNLAALAVGLWAATWAMKFWIKKEVAVCGLVSGGTQVLPPASGST